MALSFFYKIKANTELATLPAEVNLITPIDYVFRYQSLVQGQNKELSSLRRQLDQARLSCTRLRTTLDDLQRADYLEQRRLISTARRTLRKLEGELENRDESATSDCASESDYDYDSNIRSSILPGIQI